MNQNQPAAWAPSSNQFHMPSVHEGDASQDSDSPASKDVAAESGAHKVETPDDINVESTALPDDVAALGNPRQMLVNSGLATSVVDLLETSDAAKRASIIAWMQPAVLDLALSAN